MRKAAAELPHSKSHLRNINAGLSRIWRQKQVLIQRACAARIPAAGRDYALRSVLRGGSRQDLDGVQPPFDQQRPARNGQLGPAKSVSMSALRVDVHFGRNLGVL